MEVQQLYYEINGLVQERGKSIANALELRISCTNSSKCYQKVLVQIFFHDMHNNTFGCVIFKKNNPVLVNHKTERKHWNLSLS